MFDLRSAVRDIQLEICKFVNIAYTGIQVIYFLSKVVNTKYD